MDVDLEVDDEAPDLVVGGGGSVETGAGEPLLSGEVEGLVVKKVPITIVSGTFASRSRRVCSLPAPY